MHATTWVAPRGVPLARRPPLTRWLSGRGIFRGKSPVPPPMQSVGAACPARGGAHP